MTSFRLNDDNAVIPGQDLDLVDQFAAPFPGNKTYAWMALRAAGPNVLGDTSLAGITHMYNTLNMHNNSIINTSLPSHNLDSHNDIVTPTPLDKQLLQYNIGTLSWVNAYPNLNDLNDVLTGGGIGDTTGDRLTYVKNNAQVGGYPFIISPINWTNVSVISGAISFEDLATPLVVTIVANNTPTLIPFVGLLQSGAFLVTTNGLGRLVNADSFTWSFNINFSCSFTSGSNSEWTIELYIDGVKVSNAYNLTISTNGKYESITGVWTQALRGSSVPAPPTNQYCEIYITRRSGSANATINSAYLSITATKLLDRPLV